MVGRVELPWFQDLSLCSTACQKGGMGATHVLCTPYWVVVAFKGVWGCSGCWLSWLCVVLWLYTGGFRRLGEAFGLAWLLYPKEAVAVVLV